MAGSQLKRLKAQLKANGLTGQTNVKKKKGKKNKNSAIESSREEKEAKLLKIREEFSPFEVKVNRKKRDYEQNDTTTARGKPGISKQIGEQERMKAYEMQKAQKNRVGALIDKRFGENNANMSYEEKMLERFKREKQSGASKRSLFDLEDDDFDEGDEGDSMRFELKLGDDKKYGTEIDADQEAVEQPPRKKTKAEVMKEVIAKSKFYKHERQKKQAQVEQQIEQLDGDFEDIMGDLRQTVAASSATKSAKAPEKSEADIEYSKKLNLLQLEKRGMPANRTKTEDEIRKEAEEKRKQLDRQRELRMAGMDIAEEVQGDELDFWENNDENSDNGENVDGEENDSDEGEESDAEEFTRKRLIVSTCPKSHDELLKQIGDVAQSVEVIKRILKNNKAQLAPGNKEKLAAFAPVFLQHILYMADLKDSAKHGAVIEALIKLLRQMAEKYLVPITEAFRHKVDEISQRLEKHIKNSQSKDSQFPRKSDLVFFSMISVLYSTSDHYHHVVTPATLLLCESINLVQLSRENFVQGIFVTDLLLRYQRLAKRYIPETVNFLSKALEFLANLSFNNKAVSEELPELSLDDVIEGNATNETLLLLVIDKLDKQLTIWKETSAFIEIISPFKDLLLKIDSECECKQLRAVLDKIERLNKFALMEHKPLLLQTHKPIAIATYAPKFEENFNPEKRSYDSNLQRQEISKMKAQIKKEKKLTMKELRKDNKFMARQQIKENKAKYAEYHKKMAGLINSINNEE